MMKEVETLLLLLLLVFEKMKKILKEKKWKKKRYCFAGRNRTSMLKGLEDVFDIDGH